MRVPVCSIWLILFRKANRRSVAGYSLTGIGGVVSAVGFLGFVVAAADSPLAGQAASPEATRYGVVTGVGLGAFVSGIIFLVNGREKEQEAKQHVLSAFRSHHNQP
jgi:hypothetical protein